MGKRKKKQNKAAKNNDNAQSQASGFDYKPFASGLQNVAQKRRNDARRAERAAAEAERIEKARRARMLAEAQQAQRPVIAAGAFARGEEVEMTDEELFEAALNELDPIKIDRGKYGGRGPVTNHVQEPAPQPQTPQKPADPYADTDRAFEMEFMYGEIKPMEQKYFVPEAGGAVDVNKMYALSRQEAQAKAERSRAEAMEDVVQEGGPELTDDQRKLLLECKRQREQNNLPSTNLRGMSRDVALSALESAVKYAQTHKLRYIRVVTGKGLQSAAEPVLKVALVQWCTAMEVRYVPEILPDGSFGSFVLHIPRSRLGRP